MSGETDGGVEGAATRRSTSPSPEVAADGSVVPARLRIVAWIVLATAIGLTAVGLTIRSALLSDVQENANADVVQEVDEFRTFVDRARDPDTGEPFGSSARLLPLYLERQFPGPGEFLVGYDREALAGGTSPLVVQRVEDPYGLFEDPDVLGRLVDGERTSGLGEVGGEPFRWGRVDVAATDGSVTGHLVVVRFTAPADAEVARVVRLIALVCLGGLALTAAIAFVVAGQILAPVRQVRRAAARVTRAELGERITVRGRDDVAALALTFNAMMDRLEVSFTAQQRFAATASRHLRTPLGVLSDTRSGGADREAAVTEITTTLADLELLAASETPGFLTVDDVALGPFTDRLIDDVDDLAPGRARLEARAEGTVRLDPDRVRAAVRCLVANAVAESGPGSLLHLGSSVEDGHVEVWLRDEGPGLTPRQAEHVLDRYQDRGPGPGGDAEEGSEADPSGHPAEEDADLAAVTAGPGLGLAVVRAVADAHGGSAWVETEPGRGATFGLRLPDTPPGTERPDRPRTDGAGRDEAAVPAGSGAGRR